MSFSISKVPQTFIGKLMMWQSMQQEAEESFDNEEPTLNYPLTVKESELYQLIQTLGSDFVVDLIKIIEYSPNVATARNADEALNVLRQNRAGADRL